MADSLATMTRTVAMRMACPLWPDCADDEGPCLGCTEAAAVIEALERGARVEALVKATYGEPCASHWEMNPGRRPLPTDEEGEPPSGEEGFALTEGDGDEDYLGWTPFLGCAEILVSRHNELADVIERMAEATGDADSTPLPSAALTDVERRSLPILSVAAWDVVEDINRCIRSGEPPDLRTIHWWGGHLAVAREVALAERPAVPAEEASRG